MMIQKIFFRKTFWLPLLSVLLLAGCETADDRSDCFAEAFVRFEYTLNSQRTDLFTEQADGVDLFVYDHSGTFITTVRALRQNGTLNGDNRVRLTLPHGEYRVVAWANLHHGDYDYVFDCPISEKRVSLIAPANQVAGTPTALMHGMANITVNNKHNGQETTVSMTKNTNDVSIVLNIEGRRGPAKADDFSVSVSGSNGAYRFDNTLAACDRLQYLGSRTLPATQVHQTDFRVLRLLESDDMHLDIDLGEASRAGESITLPFSVSLTEEILKHPEYNTTSDLDREDKYILEYTVDLSGETAVLILIKINDWNVIEQGGPLN